MTSDNWHRRLGRVWLAFGILVFACIVCDYWRACVEEDLRQEIEKVNIRVDNLLPVQTPSVDNRYLDDKFNKIMPSCLKGRK